jgi:hypothetical protein
MWVLGGAGVMLIAIAAGLWVNKLTRRKRTVKLTGGVVAMPRRRIDMTAEKALAALLAIKASGVLDRDGDRKRGYSEMVDVIRDYLGARYRMATRDLTSRELVRELASIAPDAELEMVESWLERCDRVKYGGQKVTPVHAHSALDDARALIVTTTQLREAAYKEAA